MNKVLKNPDYYDEYGNNYQNWIKKANELLISSSILEDEYNKVINILKNQKDNKVPDEFFCRDSMIFLKAMALELLLKGLYLKYTGNLLCKNNKYVGPKSHSLDKIANEITVLELNEKETILLKDLSLVLNFWGRYPTPMNSQYWRPKIKWLPKMKGVRPIYSWNEFNSVILEKLLVEKINPLLKTN